MKQYWLICIFLSGCFSSNGQDFSTADSLFAQKDFLKSAILYEKIAFEAEEKGLANLALLKKSWCYKAMDQYHAALNILDRIRLSGKDSLIKVISYEKTLLNYLTGNYQGSYNEILKYKLVSGEASDADFIFLESLSLISQYKWQEASSLITTHQHLLGLSEEEIGLIFPDDIKFKDPDKASRLSYFLPGVGQMYAGYFFKGVFSGGVQAVLAGFSTYSLYKGYVFTGSLTGVALFYTFYLGGVRHAKELAIKYNNKKANGMSMRLGNAYQ